MSRRWTERWTGVPEVWDEFRASKDEALHPGSVNSPSRNSLRGNFRALDAAKMRMQSGAALRTEYSCIRNLIVHPGSPQRLTWDVLSMSVIMYDVIFIPWDVAGFRVNEEFAYAFVWVDRITATFWTLDIFMSFVTGFWHQGLVEMRPSRIARRYFSSWLAFDLCVVVIDWCFMLFGSFNAILRIGKSNRALRIFRTLRLVRSVKLHAKLTQVMEAVQSESLRSLSNIALLSTCILIFNHYFACGWYAVGCGGEAGRNWIEKFVADETEFVKYATSLHWSLTQFTPAAMEVHAVGLTERVYSIIVLCFAMITFSTFTGSITANMTALRKLQSDPAKQQKILQDYFSDHGISADLGHKIWSYLATHHFSYRRQLVRKDIHILNLLPQSMLSRLNEELYVPIIQRAPFFYHYGLLSFTALRHICDHTISEYSVTLGESLFSAGQVAEKMYFLTAGRMDYDHRDIRCLGELEQGMHIGDPVLFLKWSHQGNCIARTLCTLIDISSSKLRGVVRLYPKALPFVKAYAAGFAELLKNLPDELNWKTDMWMHMEKDLQGLARCASWECFPVKDTENDFSSIRSSDVEWVKMLQERASFRSSETSSQRNSIQSSQGAQATDVSGTLATRGRFATWWSRF